jgi:hypothetical protein
LVISVIINYVDRSNLLIAAPAIQRQLALSPLQIDKGHVCTFAGQRFLKLPGPSRRRCPRPMASCFKPRSKC